MSPAERQELIMATLRKERSAKVSNLANMLGCSERTVFRDIEALTLSFPLETSPGRYGGGVKLADDYQPHRSTLGPEQILALRSAVKSSTAPQQRLALLSILDQFSPRQRTN